MKPLRPSLMLLAGLALGGGGLVAGDWPQWRGPQRDGVVADHSPVSWSGVPVVAWRVGVGEGHSSPVSVDGRAFVHSRRDPEEVVTAVDLASGELLWRRRYAAAFRRNEYALEVAKGPHATPLVADKRLFTLGVTGVLSAWSTAGGELLWRRDFSDAVDTSKLFCGTAASPLIAEGLLVVQVGSDIAGGRVLALDPASGEERWSWKGPGPGYASPIVISPGERPQLVTLTESSVEGLDAATGRSLWSVPFPDEWHENIATPVWTGTRLIVGGPRQGTHAYSLHRSDAGWRAARTWKNPEVTLYMSTPVHAEGAIYGHSSRRKGQLVALDAATGDLHWATEGREGDHSSVLLAGSHLVFLTSDAVLLVARRTAAGFDEVARYQVADRATWAMPVLLSDGLLVRDTSDLLRVVFEDAQPPAPAPVGSPETRR